VTDFPEQAQPRNNLGYVYYLQGQTQLAASTLRAALVLAPAYDAARANLALIDTTASRADIAATSAGIAPPLNSPERLTVVRVAPNEFRLQAPVATATNPVTPALRSANTAADVARTMTSSTPECLHIINGNGMRGGAARMRDLLRHRGFAAASSVLGNRPGYRQARTVIEYVPGQEPRARELRAALRGPATLVPVAALPQRVTMRLVLGQDQLTVTPNLLARQERTATAFNQESP